VDEFGGELVNGRPGLLMCDFDHPTDSADCNKMGRGTPRPLEYFCGGGDSGGGLFRKKGKAWELIGICSGSEHNVDQMVRTGYYGRS
jgi:hypothetical protein